MQSNSVPYELKSMLVPLLRLGLSLQKLSRSIGTIDFEPLIVADDIAVRRVSNWEPDIVKYRGNGMSFPIPLLGMW